MGSRGKEESKEKVPDQPKKVTSAPTTDIDLDARCENPKARERKQQISEKITQPRDCPRKS